MKISFNWLKEITNTNLSIERTCEILTNTGLEVEGYELFETVKGSLEGVIVAEVVECEKLPDSDHLNLTKVNTGKETLQIVCGAPNVAKGQKVLLATIGTTLYPTPEEAFKIKKSKIRGVESNGMLCAEDELGLGKSHAGILVLPENTKVGLKASEYFSFEADYQIEIGLTPNRADAMGVYGVARDFKAYLNAIENQNIQLKELELADLKINNDKCHVDLAIENETACNRYIGVTMDQVKIQESPAWMQQRLRVVGISPINNVVDCTNYVMRELGTPLHAFDAQKLGSKVVVKNAKSGDKFITLDNVERTLSDADLMITNGNEYLAIAGVFGGKASGITTETQSIFIESAYFNPVSVRKTAKRHGLNTDASFRFERGVDPELTFTAMQRVVALIQQTAGGNLAMPFQDVNPVKHSPIQLTFTFERCHQIIGKNIDSDTIKSILLNLDFKIIEDHISSLFLEVPLYRVDVTREIDVIEEVIRIYGLNNIEVPDKLNNSLTFSNQPAKNKIQYQLSEFLVGLGCSEMMNNSLTSSSYVQKYDGKGVAIARNVQLLNPLSNELDVMRQTLLFGALESVERNQNRQQQIIRLFEFGKTYFKYEDKYEENNRLLIIFSGQLQNDLWNANGKKVSFYTLKGIVKALFDRLGLSSLMMEKDLTNTVLEDGVQLNILKTNVGSIGNVSAKMRKDFGIKSEVFVADLDWDAIIESIKLVKTIYKPLPKTFESRRDFSLLLDKNISFGEIRQIAKNAERKILKSVDLFDVYEGEKLGQDKKSYAVAFYFQDDEKTLQDVQIDKAMTKIKEQLVEKLHVELR